MERFLLLPGESQEEFDELRDRWFKGYSDTDEILILPMLVAAVVERDWLQRRCMRTICKLELSFAEAEAGNDQALIDRLEKRLANAQRYKTAAENSFRRALRELEQFRARWINEEDYRVMRKNLERLRRYDESFRNAQNQRAQSPAKPVEENNRT